MTRDLIVSIVALIFGAALVYAVIVGMGRAMLDAGPNCPAPVPADWIGFCSEYEVR